MQPVDAWASYPHYADHLRPVFDALPNQGVFYTAPGVKGGERSASLMPDGTPTLIAGYPDLKRVRGRPIIFVEHGAGENYTGLDPHYAGGPGRESVVLFLCPNRKVTDANNARYPGRAVTVGSPRLEFLASVTGRERPVSRGRPDDHPRELRVVVSFHWNATVFDATKTAFYHYQPAFRGWVSSGVRIKGHAHPRIADRAERAFAAAGIEFIWDFSEVVRWADVYAVDNSSTLYEAVALGLDVVLLDAPHFPDHIPGSWRFDKYRCVGPRISNGEELVEAAHQSVADRLRYCREDATSEIFGVIEGSIERAVEAIRKYLNDNPRTEGGTSPAPPRPDPTQPSLFGSG